MPRVNLNNPNLERNFEPMPPGIYQFQVLNKPVMEKSKNGNDMIKLELSCLNDQYRGRKVFDNMTFLENCEWKIVGFIRSAGIPLSDDGDFSLDDIQHAEVTANIKVDGQYNSVVRYESDHTEIANPAQASIKSPNKELL